MRMTADADNLQECEEKTLNPISMHHQSSASETCDKDIKSVEICKNIEDDIVIEKETNIHFDSKQSVEIINESEKEEELDYLLAIEDKNEITKESVVETKDEKVVTWPGDDLEKEED